MIVDLTDLVDHVDLVDFVDLVNVIDPVCFVNLVDPVDLVDLTCRLDQTRVNLVDLDDFADILDLNDFVDLDVLVDLTDLVGIIDEAVENYRQDNGKGGAEEPAADKAGVEHELLPTYSHGPTRAEVRNCRLNMLTHSFIYPTCEAFIHLPNM